MKLWILMIFLFPIVMTSAQEITLHSINISDTEVCLNSPTTINMNTLDIEGNIVSVNGLLVDFSTNVSGKIIQNPNQDSFVVLLENVTERTSHLRLNVTAIQGGYVVSEIKQFEVYECSGDVRQRIVDASGPIERFLFTKWQNKLIGVLMFIFVVVFIVLISGSKKKNN